MVTLLLLQALVTPKFLRAQGFSVDSSQKSMDISGDFHGASIHLPAVKKTPEFPGGNKAWHDFLKSNINISVPFTNRAKPGNYTVMIWFIVGGNGIVKVIGADTNCGYGMEGEVMRCIKKCTDWIPAETGTGKKVDFTMRTIVIFTIKQNDVIVSFN
jgi:hypothetical protein